MGDQHLTAEQIERLAQAGRQGAEAGARLRDVFLGLTHATEDARAALQNLHLGGAPRAGEGARRNARR